VDLYDGDGRFLSTVSAYFDVTLQHSVCVVPRRQSALLDYYFGRGGREASLALGGMWLGGELDTVWRGSRRVWLLHIHSESPWPRPSTAATRSGRPALEPVELRKAA
jgi:hypothetical protein